MRSIACIFRLSDGRARDAAVEKERAGCLHELLSRGIPKERIRKYGFAFEGKPFLSITKIFHASLSFLCFFGILMFIMPSKNGKWIFGADAMFAVPREEIKEYAKRKKINERRFLGD